MNRDLTKEEMIQWVRNEIDCPDDVEIAEMLEIMIKHDIIQVNGRGGFRIHPGKGINDAK